MDVLITGAGGQLGRELMATAPATCNVIGLTRSELDITDEEAVDNAMREHMPALIINTAAYTAVDRAESDQSAAFAVNAAAVGTLASAAGSIGAHLVHVSTDYVFDGARTQAYAPSDARNPISVYGRSKAAGEDAAGADATIIRTSWIYAVSRRNFVTTMLRQMQDTGQVAVVMDQIGVPTWVPGLAGATWALGIRKLPGVWHHCDDGVASWYDFAVAIAEEARLLGLLSRPVTVSPIFTSEHPTPARRPQFSVLDATRTHAALGTRAVHWRTNLRTMLAEQADRGLAF